MKQSKITKTLFIVCFCTIASYSGATNIGAHSKTQLDTTSSVQLSENFPSGTFTGDDIQLKLSRKGEYVLSGNAVDRPIRGHWKVEKKGSHILLRLIPNNNENYWLFLVRTSDMLQLVDEDNLVVLDQILNIYEATGILIRDK